VADTERTLFLIKPDAVERRLVGEIVSRFERRGLALRGMKLIRVTGQQAAEHYAEHVGKPFYPGLVEFITSGPVVAMVLEGPGAVAGVRTMMGATNPLDSAPGTIRGDYAVDLGRNVVHGSDSVASAEREIEIFFTGAELQG
jgi:nucleoside-diphosphate kinase